MELFAGLEVDRALSEAVRVRRWQRQERAPLTAPSTAHDEVELTWVDEGAARYRIGAREHEVLPGAAIVVPLGVEHATWLSGRFAAGSVRLSGALLAGVAGGIGRGLPEPSLLPRPQAAIALGRLVAAELAAPAPESARMVEALGEALALELARRGDERRPAPRDPRIARAIDLVHTCYARPISVEEMAHAATLSRYHFSQRFRAETGRAPYAYLLEVRLDRAAAMLRRGGASATFAALSAGFTDLGRFHRMFRRRFGVSPSSFAAAPHDSPHDSPETH